MKTYQVVVKEVWRSYVSIDAESKEDAITRVKGGAGMEVETDYDYTLESDTWEVFEE